MTRLPRRLWSAAIVSGASSVVGFLGVVTTLLPACDVDLGQRVAPSGSFGNIVFREACQRVTYSAEIDGKQPIEVSGAQSRVLCSGQAAPDSASPTVKALFQQRANVVAGVDTGVPVELQSPLDTYLRAIQPLQDDGTMDVLLQRSGDALQKLASDGATTAAIAKLSHQAGIRPRQTAGGLLRAVTAAASFDDFTGAALPLLDKGGAAEGDFKALLTGAAFELRHLERSSEVSTSPERSAALLRDLLTATRPELMNGQSVLLALRDPRGLPLLNEVVAPYVLDTSTGLAKANADGYFLDAAGRPLPYVPPLPDVGAGADGSRDAQGRALRPDGKLLYRYVDFQRLAAGRAAGGCAAAGR
ncbi:MAG: hypothetical protein QM769_03270 [Pseudoxanthomonas sp.]